MVESVTRISDTPKDNPEAQVKGGGDHNDDEVNDRTAEVPRDEHGAHEPPQTEKDVIGPANVIEDAAEGGGAAATEVRAVTEAVDQAQISLTAKEIEAALDNEVQKESINTVSRLEGVRFKPKEKSRFNIPLCRLKGLTDVRPAMRNDIANLQRHFSNGGYIEGQAVFYVALENDDSKTADVTDDDRAS